MPPAMRAKMRVSSVENFGASEKLNFSCVTTKPFGPEGESEDNTFARYTPSGGANVHVTNPALVGQYKAGDTFYVDFTPAE